MISWQDTPPTNLSHKWPASWCPLCHPAWFELLKTRWEMSMLLLGSCGQFMHLLCNIAMLNVWWTVYQRAWMCLCKVSHFCVMYIIAVLYVNCCGCLVPCWLLTVHYCYTDSLSVCFLTTHFIFWKRFPRQSLNTFVTLDTFCHTTLAVHFCRLYKPRFVSLYLCHSHHTVWMTQVRPYGTCIHCGLTDTLKNMYFCSFSLE